MFECRFANFKSQPFEAVKFDSGETMFAISSAFSRIICPDIAIFRLRLDRLRRISIGLSAETKKHNRKFGEKRETQCNSPTRILTIHSPSFVKLVGLAQNGFLFPQNSMDLRYAAAISLGETPFGKSLLVVRNNRFFLFERELYLRFAPFHHES